MSNLIKKSWTDSTLQAYHHLYFLGNDDEGDEEHYGDYLDLCVLKYGANGVLEVSPDFTNNRKPYTIELEHKKETFEASSVSLSQK